MGSTLQRLGDSNDLDIAENEPDIRGWDVVISDGTKVGEVDDLIVDTAAMKARYVDVELDRSAMGLDEKRHALVPIGLADLDTDDKRVSLRGIDRQGLLQLHDMDFHSRSSESIGAMQESTTTSAATAQTTDFETTGQTTRGEGARLTRSAEELRIGKRMVQAGEVRVSKHVETEHVTQTVPRERERVTVERRPASPGASTSPQIGADEIVVPVMEEEIVVEKRPVVKEELVIAKERVTEQQEVGAELRREEFDIKGGDEEVIRGSERDMDRTRTGER